MCPVSFEHSNHAKILDGTFSYEDDDFQPIPLDLYTAASLGEDDVIQHILDRQESFQIVLQMLRTLFKRVFNTEKKLASTRRTRGGGRR